MNALRQTARARLRGALLGLTTPFTAAGAFDEEAFRRNVDFYIFNPALEHRYEHALEAMDLGELRQLHAALSPLRRFFSEVDAPVTLKARAGHGAAGRGPGAPADVNGDRRPAPAAAGHPGRSRTKVVD